MSLYDYDNNESNIYEVYNSINIFKLYSPVRINPEAAQISVIF